MYPLPFARARFARIRCVRFISRSCWLSAIEIMFDRASIWLDAFGRSVDELMLWFCHDIWTSLKTHSHARP